MEYIQKFFAVIVDFIVFALTGKTLSFAATFAEIQSFTSSFDGTRGFVAVHASASAASANASILAI